jgi:hypothetical protein
MSVLHLGTRLNKTFCVDAWEEVGEGEMEGRGAFNLDGRAGALGRRAGALGRRPRTTRRRRPARRGARPAPARGRRPTGRHNRVRKTTAGNVEVCQWKKRFVPSTFHGGGSCGRSGHSCPYPCRPSCSCPCRTLPFHRPRPRPLLHRVLPCKSKRQRDQGQR